MISQTEIEELRQKIKAADTCDHTVACECDNCIRCIPLYEIEAEIEVERFEEGVLKALEEILEACA